MTSTYAELCAGYDGLGQAVGAVFGAKPIWFSEFESAPSRVLAHHYSMVPNLGDMTRIDWAKAPCPTILSGGTPCQDLSAAGARKGMTEGTRSNLWVQMREAIATLQPEWVVWENVRGAFSARADSSVESEPGLLGDTRSGGPFLRALGRVLGDLSDLGYDTEWRGLRASDIGAPHHRFRVFVLAHRRDVPLRHTRHDARSTKQRITPEKAASRASEPGKQYFPTPKASDGEKGGPNQRGSKGDLALPAAAHLLPTPNAQNSNDGEGYETWEARRQRVLAKGINGNGAGMPLSIAVQLLPTPGANIASNGGSQHPDKRRSGGHQPSIQDVAEHEFFPTPRATRGGSGTETMALLGTPSTSGRDADHATHLATRVIRGPDWGQYEPAIRRWERVLGREAPAATQPSPKTGKPQLSPAFVEWMMGCPEGRVTNPAIWANSKLTLAGIRNAQLKMLGNGVITQQAITAISNMRQAFINEWRQAA